MISSLPQGDVTTLVNKAELGREVSKVGPAGTGYSSGQGPAGKGRCGESEELAG